MRITAEIRLAVVRAVMADVPKINYREQAQARVQSSIYETFPLSVKAVYDDPKTQKYLERSGYAPPFVEELDPDSEGLRTIRHAFGYMYLVTDPESTKCREHWLPLLDLARLSIAQDEALENVETQLRASFASIKTSGVFIKHFPEFEKYLPKEETPNPQPLAPTNLITDLMKLGWK